MAIVAEALGPVPWSERDWDAAPDAVADVLADPGAPERAAEALGEASGLACVGRGYLLPVALEAALKLREAAGIRAEGWSAADFRHGPATITGDAVPMLAISAGGPAAADVADLARRWSARGGTVLRLADEPEAELPFERRLAEPLARAAGRRPRAAARPRARPAPRSRSRPPARAREGDADPLAALGGERLGAVDQRPPDLEPVVEHRQVGGASG